MLKGFLYGIATSVTFGLIPLFTLPLMAKGMHIESILLYRFLFATVALGLMMKLNRETFHVKRGEIPFFFLLGFMYTVSAMFLFWGYDYMGAGIATTLHFTYPVFVTLFMLLFFREKTSWITLLAVVMAVAGVARLSINGEVRFSLSGVLMVLLSAVGYATYIIVVNKSRIRNMNGRKLAFYVFVVSTLIFGLRASTHTGIQPIPDAASFLNLVLLAVVPTVISNITLVLAVHRIGGTLTSVLGAMEPMTAVAIGAVIFGEPFTSNEALGIMLIIVAVTMIILSGTIRQGLSSVLKRFRPRHA